MQNDTSLYSERESDLLSKNLELRQKVIDSITNNGTEIPTNSGQLRLLDLYLTGADTSIHKTAENRTKFKDASSTENMMKMVTELLKGANKKINEVPERNSSLVIDDIIPLDLVEGETSIGLTNFDVKEFVEE